MSTLREWILFLEHLQFDLRRLFSDVVSRFSARFIRRSGEATQPHLRIAAGTTATT